MGKDFMDFILHEKYKGVLNWRIPDESGLCERNLDCFQLCVKEILSWKKVNHHIPIFIQPFNTTSEGLRIRTGQAQLQLGWGIEKWEDTGSLERTKEKIQEFMREEGYCLIYYSADQFPLSSYFGIYPVIHWSIVTRATDDELVIIDNAGLPSVFENQIGCISWTRFLNAWQQTDRKGIAIVVNKGWNESWDIVFDRVRQESVRNMLYRGGMDQFTNYLYSLENTNIDHLISCMEQIEFELHHYRRRRLLWLLAYEKKCIPKSHLRPEWIELLSLLCNSWSLVLGVAMKWKKQLNRDYRSKFLFYLRDIESLESQFFENLDYRL